MLVLLYCLAKIIDCLGEILCFQAKVPQSPESPHILMVKLKGFFIVVPCLLVLLFGGVLVTSQAIGV